MTTAPMRTVLVATPASASYLDIAALQMFQAFHASELSFSVKRDSNDAVVLYTGREANHKKLAEKIQEKFPGRFREQSVPERLLT